MLRKTWSWTTVGGVFAGRSHGEIQAICRSAGLAGIEGSAGLFAGNTDAELEAIGAGYREAGLKVDTFHLPFTALDDMASFYETSRALAVATARRWIERAALLGARVGIMHLATTRYSVDVEGFENYLRPLGRSLETLLPVAERVGFTLALENMLPGEEGGRFGSRPEHFERFAREFDHPNLGFCLDTGHALVAGGRERAGEFLTVMAPRLVAFHLADNAGDRDSHLAPGHGLVDWTRVFRSAAEMAFSGTMCIETPPFAPAPYRPEDWRQMVADTEALVDQALGGG